MDALAFCVFDKFSKGFKASHVLNTQKMSFKCKFNFEVNGVDYYIEREGKSDKKGTVKVDVKFYKIEKGNEVPLNGEARRSTNDIIRDYVGTYEDFILTVLSIQNSKAGSFIDLGQTERKDLLCQFMGLNMFDQLYTIANDNFKETNTLLKNTSKEQLVSELTDVSGSIVTNNNNIETYTNIVKQKEGEKDSLNNKMLELSNTLIKTDSFSFDITKLEQEKVDLTGEIDKINVNISTEKVKLKTIEDSLVSLTSSLVECDGIDDKYDEYKSWKQKETEKQKEIDTLKLVIKNKVEKLKKLEEHKYDPNCTYCVNNIFVKDAIKTKEDLELDKQKATKIVGEFNNIKEKLDSYGDIEKQNKECIKLNNEKLTFERNKSSVNSSVLQNENTLINLQNKLKNVEDNIQTFYTNKEVIENNVTILTNVEKVKSDIKSVENEIKALNNKLFTASGEKGKLELQHKNLTDQLNKVKELEESYESYKLYTNIISRDGIPYEIITKTLPEIEKEVNNILHQLVEFSVTLHTDGKNIMTNIVYEDKKWPLEMASGMEKFISGLAIRVALINISNLPRPNIICIDEGFGCADSDHLSQMGSLFSYLKNQFDFIWIISHLDQMRDMVDSQIEIKKENGLSKVIYR
jgi:DNA repair exonuclease SbcCD ATPase subunit